MTPRGYDFLWFLHKKYFIDIPCSTIKKIIMSLKKIKPTMIDLFCGAGGLSLGFELAGFEVIGAIDCFKDACETFQKNHRSLDPKRVIQAVY